MGVFKLLLLVLQTKTTGQGIGPTYVSCFYRSKLNAVESNSKQLSDKALSTQIDNWVRARARLIGSQKNIVCFTARAREPKYINMKSFVCKCTVVFGNPSYDTTHVIRANHIIRAWL